MTTATSPDIENRDYKSKTQSIISVCNRGSGDEQLKVFDNTAKYLYKFVDSRREGEMGRTIGLL